MHCLRFLGEVSVGSRSDSAQQQLSRPRSVALLAVLAACDGDGVTRDRLTALFWEDADRSHARHSLSNQLHLLRAALGSEAILTHGEFVRLNPNLVTTDVHAFRDAYRSGALERAADAYSGPLLDGFHLDGSSEFERWLNEERQFLSLQALEVFETLADRAAAENQPDLAVKWLQRAVHHDPYNSRAAVALATALATWRDPGNGVQLLKEHVNRLKEDLGIEPDPEILTLIETGDFAVDPHFESRKQVGANSIGGLADVRQDRVRRNGHRRMVFAAAAACVVLVLAAAYANRERGEERFDPDLVAVLPVRAVGVDSPVALLAMEKLNAELADWQELRIAQPERVEGEWQSLAGRIGGGRSPEIARSVGQRIGAGVVLTARVTAAEQGVELYGSLMDSRSGAVLTSARSTGVLDGLSSAAHAMVVQLFAEWRGILPDRVATLAQHDPDAVRLFIAAHPHDDERGDWLLKEAIARDSSFALAALELYDSYDGRVNPSAVADPTAAPTLEAWEEIASLVWSNRDRLSPADRAYAKARLGWRFAEAHTARLEVAAWEDAVDTAPDRLAHWQGLFRACYTFCSSYARSWMNPLLEVHDALLARGDSSAVEEAMEVALMAGDSARLRAYADLLPADAWYGRWLAAIGLGREEERAAVEARLPDLSHGWLVRLGNFAILTGLGLDDAEKAAVVVPNGRQPGSVYSLRQAVLARERGRHAEYRRLRDKMFQLFDVNPHLEALAAANVIAEWATYAEPETEATLDEADRVLSRVIERKPSASADTLEVAHCYRSWLRLERGDTAAVNASIRLLDTEPSVRRRALARMCAPFLSYLVERDRGREAHGRAAARLYDEVRDQPVTFGELAGTSLTALYISAAAKLQLARSFGELGYPETGLQILERRPMATGNWGLYGWHIDFVREEARLLARAGETDAALARYEKYFRIRPGPPDLESWAAEWNVAREEYEALRRSAGV